MENYKILTFDKRSRMFDPIDFGMTRDFQSISDYESPLTNAIFTSIYERPRRVAVVGDYFYTGEEKNDKYGLNKMFGATVDEIVYQGEYSFKPVTAEKYNLAKRLYKLAWGDKPISSFVPAKIKMDARPTLSDEGIENLYLVNLSKRRYINLGISEHHKSMSKKNEKSMKKGNFIKCINPLIVLCRCGQDFRVNDGSLNEYLWNFYDNFDGKWACDVIMVTSKEPSGYFHDMTYSCEAIINTHSYL